MHDGHRPCGRLTLLAPLLAASVVFFAPVVRAQSTQPTDSSVRASASTDFLRLIDKGTSGSRLETADVAFRNAEGVTVHLVSAVHVGERDYFEGLNQNFKLRDAVLYEMVKPKDVAAPLPGNKLESHSPVSDMQRMMKQVLGLEFQLDVVDYSAPNFVHADMDAETFEKMQAERGESFTTMFLQAFMKQLAQPQPENAANANGDDMDKALEDLVKLITRPDMERQLKLRLARQLVDMENNPFSPGAMDGTVLLTERNKAAMATLTKTLASGKRDIALFYGAAHMQDFAKRLGEIGFKPIATEWRLAWDLTIRVDSPSAVEKLLMEAIKGLGEEQQEPEPDRGN